jgi:hypothetical protein
MKDEGSGRAFILHPSSFMIHPSSLDCGIERRA